MSIADLLVPHIYAHKHKEVYIVTVMWFARNSLGKEIFYDYVGVAWCYFFITM